MSVNLTWDELVEAVLNRRSEISASTFIDVEIPYFDKQDAEDCLVEVSNMLLREIPIPMLQAFRSPATQTNIYADQDAIPVSVVRTYGGRIDSKMSEPVVPAVYFQNRFAVYGGYNAPVYTFYDGIIRYNGSACIITEVRELTLAQYRSLGFVLPADYDDERIELASGILTLADKLPYGKL